VIRPSKRTPPSQQFAKEFFASSLNGDPLWRLGKQALYCTKASKRMEQASWEEIITRDMGIALWRISKRLQAHRHQLAEGRIKLSQLRDTVKEFSSRTLTTCRRRTEDLFERSQLHVNPQPQAAKILVEMPNLASIRPEVFRGEKGAFL